MGKKKLSHWSYDDFLEVWGGGGGGPPDGLAWGKRPTAVSTHDQVTDSQLSTKHPCGWEEPGRRAESKRIKELLMETAMWVDFLDVSSHPVFHLWPSDTGKEHKNTLKPTIHFVQDSGKVWLERPICWPLEWLLLKEQKGIRVMDVSEKRCRSMSELHQAASPSHHHPWLVNNSKKIVSGITKPITNNILQVVVKITQSCPTLCSPIDYTVLQARILEWVAFPFSRGSSQPRDWTQVSHIAGGFSTSWATREALWCYNRKLFKHRKRRRLGLYFLKEMLCFLGLI